MLEKSRYNVRHYLYKNIYLFNFKPALSPGIEAAFIRYKMKIKFYHLTDCENAAKIMQEGIKANKNDEIFVFTDMLVANSIAKTQVFTQRYSVFKIDRKGISGKILKDNVEELTAGYHRIIKQKLIKPKFLKFICEKKTIVFEPTKWDYLYHAQLFGMTRNEVDQQFSKMKKSVESRPAISEDEISTLLKNAENFFEEQSNG